MDGAGRSASTGTGSGRGQRRWYRSYLYVPAIEPRRMERALASDADAIVLDLEDSVPLDRKDEACRAARDFLLGMPPKPTFVRVNAFNSGLLKADIEAVACEGLAGVRLPKAENSNHVRFVLGQLRQHGCDVPIVPIIESALGVERAVEIASADHDVAAMAMGEADLRLDLGTSDDQVLDHARARCVIASRAAGLPGPIQSVWTQVHDDEGLLATTLRGRAMGFSGRSAIHPGQLSVINEVFTPSQDELRWALEVLDSYRRAGRTGGAATAVTPSGEFVDLPVVRRAAAIVELAGPPSG